VFLDFPTSMLARLVATGLFGLSESLDVVENSIEGTRSEMDGFSQKQLAMIRYFSHLTFMTETDEDPWKPWEVDGKLPNGGGGEAGDTPFGDLRYQLSHVAYSAGIAAQRTPAYTEVAEQILKSASRRMLLPLVWAYTPDLYPKDDTNGGSDPISWKNIMYSGHLAQVMALQQTISGDMAFSENSFDFKYANSTSTFNLEGVMRGMYNQMFPPGGNAPDWATWYEGGGVPCEPVMIFLLCNNFPHNAFHMHDGIHGTNFQDSDGRWQQEIITKAVNRQPKKPRSPTRGDYFKIGYLNALRRWIPDAPIQGGDSWALAWIRGWWNETNPDAKELIYNGYVHLANHAGWKVDKATGGSYHTSTPASFDFIATSFFPMIERQFWTPDSGITQRSDDIMTFFEQYGELVDTDGDGIKDSYRYVKDKDGYRDAANANILTGMVFPNDGSSNGMIRDLFQASPAFFQKHAHQPRILHAEFPAVMVPVARYDSDALALNFQLVAGDKPMQEGEVKLTNCRGMTGITLNGEIFSDYIETSSGDVTLKIPAPNNIPQVWQVTFSPTVV